jgi:hypothetical protein
MKTIRCTVKNIDYANLRVSFGDGEPIQFPDRIDFAVGDELLLLYADLEEATQETYWARYNITRQKGTLPMPGLAELFAAVLFYVVVTAVLADSGVSSRSVVIMTWVLSVVFLGVIGCQFILRINQRIRAKKGFVEELIMLGIKNPVVRFSRDSRGAP